MIKKYTFRELTDRSSPENLKKQQAAIDEIRQRVNDACVFNHITLDEEPDIEFYVPLEGYGDMDDGLDGVGADDMAAADGGMGIGADDMAAAAGQVARD